MTTAQNKSPPQHTPGSWGWEGTFPYANSARIISTQTNEPIASLLPCKAAKETEANARLIAAAPELLEALEALANDVEKVARDSYAHSYETFRDDFRNEDAQGYALWSQARAAIAKAKRAA